MNSTIVSKDAEKVFIGVDVHRKQYTACCIKARVVIKRCRVTGTPAELVKFIKKYFPHEEVHTAYEAGFSGFLLHRTLVKAGIDNIVVHAASIELPLKKSKTDKRDSLKIAEQLADGRLKGIQVPTEEQENRRLITRTRDQLMRTRIRCMNQMRMKLHQYGCFPLEHRGVLRSEFVLELIEQGMSHELSLVLKNLLAVKKSIENEIQILNKEFRKYAKEDPLVEIYMQVPGFGLLTSYRLATELGDLGQFSNERRLFSFTGLIPGEFTTSESRHLGHITRQGRSSLRHILVEAAWVAIGKDPALRETFDRIAQRAGKKRAIVAIARKLIGRARALFRKKETYQLNYRRAA
jgi:transposase